MRSRTPANFAEKQKLLLVASTGGHLAELVRLLPGLNASDDSLWVTFRTPQSESLLAGRRVFYVPYVRPRDYRGIARAALLVNRLLSREKFDRAVSTGSAVALGVLPVAALRSIPTLYVESVCRVTGPSATGKVLAALKFTEMRTQHPGWSDRSWGNHESILTTYHSTERLDRPKPRRMFVTLGTIEGFRFDSMVDALLASGLVNDDTVWQLGFTTRTDLPGTVYESISPDEFSRYTREADVVVTHAGVGSLLNMLNEGVFPVLVTRRSARGEHVDDHQVEIAALVNELSIGIAVDSTELTAEVLIDAAHRAIVDNEPRQEALA